MTALCPACAEREPAPVLCTRCTERARDHLDRIGRARRMLDPRPGRTGASGKAAGKPGSRPPANLTVLAITDRRTRRIVAGWHDTECGDEACTDRAAGRECADPAHRQDTADDVACVDHELVMLARMCRDERHLAAALADVFDAIRMLRLSLDWLVRHPAADEHVAILADCAGALAVALRDRPEPALARCPEADGDGDCGGPMRWDADVVRCGKCGSAWTIDDLRTFSRVAPLDVWGSIPAVADLLGMHERTLRRWVSSGQVRRDAFGRVHHGQAFAVRQTRRESAMGADAASS